MKTTNYLVVFVITAALLTGCKDSAIKSSTGKTEVDVKKKGIVVQKPETATFKVDGMTCAMGCARTIEEKLSKMEGVQKATVDFDNKQAKVDFDAAVLTPEQLTKAVESTGDGETYKVSEMKTKG